MVRPSSHVADHVASSICYEVLPAILIGVGFLGGGVLNRTQAGEQRDITSASSVWAVAVLGIFIGLGRIFLPVALTLLILFVLEIEHIPVLRRLDLGLRRAVKEQTAEPAVNRGRDEGD
jgi:uncharacterized membrane protein YhiD involved in acid resistance